MALLSYKDILKSISKEKKYIFLIRNFLLIYNALPVIVIYWKKIVIFVDLDT